MEERYKTLNSMATAEVVEKKSRFIACCTPLQSEDAAIGFIESVRAKHRTATHNVYAYALRQDNLCRYSDDGEPQGTAGLPVLDILKRGGIVDAAVVVTRYFGGTLLGTGGLVRAYAEAAAQAVKQAGVAVMERCAVYRIVCPYPLYDRLQKLLGALDAAVLSSGYAEAVTVEAAVLAHNAARLLEEVSELTRGQDLPQHLYDDYRCVKVE